MFMYTVSLYISLENNQRNNKPSRGKHTSMKLKEIGKKLMHEYRKRYVHIYTRHAHRFNVCSGIIFNTDLHFKMVPPHTLNGVHAEY